MSASSLFTVCVVCSCRVGQASQASAGPPIFWCTALLAAIAVAQPAAAQSVSNLELRPFVTGWVPVVGPNGVGGVSIDARGVLARCDVAAAGQLREARLKALAQIDAPADAQVSAVSPMRKISLRGLQQEIQRRRQSGRPVDDQLQNLAGLTRVEFVFVDSENRDLVMAGPAEGWHVDQQGNLVGRKSNQPPVQLDDLVVALRTAKAAITGSGISCSIDPTEEGLRRLQPLLRARNLTAANHTAAQLARLEEALGQQQITVTGVPPSSHFARVLVAADFLMKRLGMNLEPAPIDGLPSYLEMLQARSAAPPKNALPRWWMEPHYEPLLKDELGLAWQLRGSGVRTLTEDGYVNAAGSLVNTGKEHPLAKKWADAMTTNYASLARALPIFAELRNCMDLAVVAALFVKEDLPAKAGCDLSLLLDERRVAIAEYPVPKTVDSRASLVRKGSTWILSLSGGVQVDSWSVLSRTETSENLTDKHRTVIQSNRDHWWWD
jgi:hypothetical protein